MESVLRISGVVIGASVVVMLDIVDRSRDGEAQKKIGKARSGKCSVETEGAIVVAAKKPQRRHSADVAVIEAEFETVATSGPREIVGYLPGIGLGHRVATIRR
jgi:hypothetical protein